MTTPDPAATPPRNPTLLLAETLRQHRRNDVHEPGDGQWRVRCDGCDWQPSADLFASWYDACDAHATHVAAVVGEWLLTQGVIAHTARAMALLEPGEEWPSNEALGGSLTGTRDDEYRDAMHDEARDTLTALAALTHTPSS